MADIKFKKRPKNSLLVDLLELFRVLLFVVLFFILSSCSRNLENHLEITLNNLHIEDVASGDWINNFKFDRLSSKNIKTQVYLDIIDRGELVDEFLWEEHGNEVFTRVYELENIEVSLNLYNGGIFNGPNLFPPQQYHSGDNLWISYEFNEPISYKELIPNNFQKLEEIRKYEHSATITSKLSKGTRLFLFGFGSFCKKVTLY